MRHLLRNVKLGVKNLLLHKLRSVLTMLGIVFGVGSVVAMLSVGEGASKEALGQIRKLGSNNIIINSMKPVDETGSGAAVTRMSVYGLFYDDEVRIKETFPDVQRTVPVKLVRKEGRLRDAAMELRVVGTTWEWFMLVEREVLAGRVLLPRDQDEFGNVAVLTEHGARRLLATSSAIGESLRIGNDYYEVIGIIRSETTQGGGIQTPDQEVDAYIPINLARQRYGDMVTRRTTGSVERENIQLHQMIIQTRSSDDVEAVATGIETMLRRFHKKNDFRMSVPLALLRQAEATKRTFNIVLGSIAGISLLVGGIGIMNIMLASVMERTREIGVRRAIGAKRRQIVMQFLIETVVLSTIGGLIGVGIGAFIPWLITRFAGMPTEITAYSLILSVSISMVIGIIFGLYPAARAANLDPIVALRHE
jgi:putative ABC transport system permease protein